MTNAELERRVLYLEAVVKELANLVLDIGSKASQNDYWNDFKLTDKTTNVLENYDYLPKDGK